MHLKSFDRKHFSVLARQRQMTSLLEREIAASGTDFIEIYCDWIRAVYDPSQKVTSDDGLRTAFRAVSDQGELHWLVYTDGKVHPCHSEASCPFDAFEEARFASIRRKAVRSNWAEVETLIRDLRTGRVRFGIELEDAYASPLCAMGVRHFLRRVGLSRARRLPGVALAWLAALDPQLGFVIAQAAHRVGHTEIAGATEGTIAAG